MPQNIAAVALKNLSEDKPRRRRLTELGVIPVLTTVVKTTRNLHSKDAATVALRNITAEGGGDASVSDIHLVNGSRVLVLCGHISV